MTSSSPHPKEPLRRGDYARAGPTDLRGPCPMINCLANHDYLPRDGRNVRVEDLTSALPKVGVASTLASVFSNPIFQEHAQYAAINESEAQPASLWRRALRLVSDPWSALASFGMRKPGQVDSEGHRVLNLDQLALHGVVEHDASLTRRDAQQGDNLTMQPDFLRELLASSSDGGETLTIHDLAALRRRRIKEQREINPEFTYGASQHQPACGEIALILGILGDGEKARCDHVRVFFEEERLPIEEGWKGRGWWAMGLVEFFSASRRISTFIGPY